MKRLIKANHKIFVVILMVTFFASLFPIYPPISEVSAASMTLEECNAKYQGVLTPPPGFPICIAEQVTGQKLVKAFNQTLWDKQQVVVYGNEFDVNTKYNDFKTKWQLIDGTPKSNADTLKCPTDPNGICHPYYTKNGEKGEYRYYGYDRNGNKYTNPFFLRDADSGLDPDEKMWIYRPWISNLTVGNRQRPSGFSSVFGNKYQTADDIYNKGLVDTVDKIVHNDDFNGGIIEASGGNPKDPHITKTTRKLFDYMYVEQAPTVWAPGQGLMFHKKADGGIWYQDFPIAKSTGKKQPGMLSTTIKPRETLNMDLSKLPDTWTWTFDFQSIMNDNRKVDPNDQDVMYKDPFRKLEYYTRGDVNDWKFTINYSFAGKLKIVKTFTTDDNGKVTFADGRSTGKYSETVTFHKSDFAEGDTINIELTAEAHYGTTDAANVFDSGTATFSRTFSSTPTPHIDEVDNVPPPWPPANKELPPPLECKPNIPLNALDIVAFPASDGTDQSKVQERKVWVDGAEVDDVAFFSGQYVFGDDADGLHLVSVRWKPYPPTDPDVPPDYDPGCASIRWINVHDTMPRAQFTLFGGLFKENRKMSIDDTSAQAIDPFVQAAYPIVNWQWSWSAIEGSDTDRRMKTDAAQHKEFLYKKPGEYRVSLTVTNALGRKSTAYVLPFTVLRDEAPAVIFYPYSSQISREDAVTLFDDAASTDGDAITTQSFRVYYDVNGDETYSQLIDSFTGAVTQYKPPVSKLGKYRIKVTVDEDFGQETFPEFITAADRRSTTKQFEFEVDNDIPYSDIYTDIPTVRPQIDAYFMADKNLAQSKIDYLKGNGVTIDNAFRKEGADPQVSVWDMHTYTYSQPASTTYRTGTSYPPSTYDYCSSGYCGTLHRDSVTDNGSNQDFGYDATRQMSDSKTATDSRSQSGSTSCGSTVSSTIPGSVSYSSGGYSGTLSQSSYSYSDTSDATCKSGPGYTGSYSFSRYATYSGTVTKYWTETYHVYDWRWVSNYYGYYSGTIYKDVRQPFTNPFSRTTSDKYVIYISDSIVNDLADFNMVKGISDAKIILVGSAAIQAQCPTADYIANAGQPIDDLVQSVIDRIAAGFAPTASQTVQVNETFNLFTEETDPENDPIVQKETMYIHNENFYDNPTGHASFALSAYDPAKWTAETLRTSFAYPGEYHILRRVKDQPSPDPKLSPYSYYSNEAETIIRVHRKPIAAATLDWTYDPNCSCYLTTWVDKSYDLDHNISDPVNKGIVERKIRYLFGGEWYYRIPAQLVPGTYRLEYTVKDSEGAWSDPFVMNFTLNTAPPPQLDGNVRAEDDAFTISGGVPAGENLVAEQLWTRFPASLNLQFLMNPSGNYINRTVNYFTGTKTGSDINWNDVTTTIPATTPDGTYTYRIQANGSNGTTAARDFSVNVLTPIQLRPDIRNPDGTAASVVVNGYPVTLSADTTEYPNQVTVKAYKGTAFERTVSLGSVTMSAAGAGAKHWSQTFTAGGVPDGNYTFEWRAQTPNGNTETKILTVRTVSNTPPTGDFSMFTYNAGDPMMPVFEGDLLHVRSVGVTDNEKDLLSVRYEILDPAGSKKWDETFAMAYPYAATGPNYILPGVSAGTWTVRQTIQDGKAPPVIRTKTLLVRPLGVQGFVRHTDAWETNRLRYNDKHPDAPRPPDWFWAGEAFVLEATVTDTGSSGTKPAAVRVSASHGLLKDLTAAGTFPALWQGTLRSEDAGSPLSDLPEGLYTFTFTVTYSNGTVRTSTAVIRLADTVDRYVQVHRVQ